MLAPMISRRLALAALMTLAGCATASLPYFAAQQQPSGGACQPPTRSWADRLRIEIDSGGRRIEEAAIVKASGGALRAQAIDRRCRPGRLVWRPSGSASAAVASARAAESAWGRA